MERLQHELFEAATSGSVSSLQQLLIDDPLLLDRATPNYNSETVLHVSALLGHLDFVKEIIGIKPELTNELNSQQSSPLHLASVKGHVNVVRELLSVVGHETMCLARDKDGLTPLHLAARKGRVEVMELLLGAQPEAARLTLYGGETILHLCVKNWQVEALKLLVSSVSDPEFVKCKDGEGNTLLHLAVEYKQLETIKLLVNNGAADQVDVNAVNHKGLTAMDVLIGSRSDVRDSEIRESLNRAAAGGAGGASMADRRIHKHSLVKHVRDFENSIMVMASIVAAMAFQVALYPPGGVWQDDNYLFNKAGKTVDPLGNRISHAVDSKNETVLNPHRAGYSILATNYYDLLLNLYRFNTVAYCSSLSVLSLMVLGVSSTNKFFAWIVLLAAELAIYSALNTYDRLVEAWMPSKDDSKTIKKPYASTVMYYFFVICLLATYLNEWIRSRRRSRAASSAVPVGENNTSVV